jgi:hypothetical protein
MQSVGKPLKFGTLWKIEICENLKDGKIQDYSALRRFAEQLEKEIPLGFSEIDGVKVYCGKDHDKVEICSRGIGILDPTTRQEIYASWAGNQYYIATGPDKNPTVDQQVEASIQQAVSKVGFLKLLQSRSFKHRGLSPSLEPPNKALVKVSMNDANKSGAFKVVSIPNIGRVDIYERDGSFPIANEFSLKTHRRIGGYGPASSFFTKS